MFRFIIRDLLWLTVIVALGCCWYGSYRTWSHLLEWSQWEAHVNWIMYKDLQETLETAKRRGAAPNPISIRGNHEDLKVNFRQHRGWPADASNYIAELEKEVETYDIDYSVVWELLDDGQRAIAATKATNPKYIRTGRLEEFRRQNSQSTAAAIPQAKLGE